MNINVQVQQISFSIVGLLSIVFMGILFDRYDIPVWKAIIPIYNQYIFARDIAKAPGVAKKRLTLSIAVLIALLVFYAALGVAILRIFKTSTMGMSASSGDAGVILFIAFAFVIFLIIALVFSIIYDYEVFRSYNKLHGYSEWLTYLGVLFPVIALGIYVFNNDRELPEPKEEI
jgi:hypothetical protein